MDSKGIWDDREFGYAHAHSETLAIAVAKIIGSSNKFDEKINREEWPVYDLGCGNGWYTSFLKANGFKCIGYDGNPGSQTDDDIRRFDLTDKLVLNPKGTILCLEVAEHIPKQYEDILLDNIVRNCSGKVILSWAVPGQGGLGHVNEQPNWYVVEKFRSLGFAINGTQTEFLRAAVKNDACWWFKNTLLVFDRLPSSAENFEGMIHDIHTSVSTLTHSLRELQNPYFKEEKAEEEKYPEGVVSLLPYDKITYLNGWEYQRWLKHIFTLDSFAKIYSVKNSSNEVLKIDDKIGQSKIARFLFDKNEIAVVFDNVTGCVNMNNVHPDKNPYEGKYIAGIDPISDDAKVVVSKLPSAENSDKVSFEYVEIDQERAEARTMRSEEHPAEEKRNLHWWLGLSDQYTIMTYTQPDFPQMNEGRKSSDEKTMFTMSECSAMNKLVDKLMHPKFSAHMDKDKLNHKLKEFEERIIQIMKNDKA